jgi:WD40 repeat protein
VIGSREHATLLDLRGNEVASLALHPEEVFTPAARLSHHERRCYGAIAGGIQSDTVYTIAGTGRLRQFDAAGARQQERVLERIDGIDWCGADRDPSAEFVALGNLAGTLALFRADGTLEWQKRLHDGPLRYVRFSPDRRFVLASTGIVPDWSVLDRYVPCSDHAATVVDLRGETRWTLARHQANITSATWSPSGTHVATSSFDREVRVWHLPTTPTAEPFGVTILPHATAVLGSGFFLEDRQVLSGAFKGNAAVWSTFRRERTASLQSHGSGIASWTVVAGSDQVLTTSYDRRLQLFDSRSRWREEWETDAPLAHALWDPLGDSVWTMDRTGLTRRWRPGRRESDLSFDLGPRLVDRELVLHGTWWTGRECLVIRTTSNRVLTVDLRSGDVFELASARGTKSQPGHSAFLCASGDTVVWGGGSSSTIQVWRNQQTRDLKLPEYQGVMDAWLAPDGSWAAFGMGEDAGRLVFEDLAKGEATRVVSTPGQVQGVAAAPDGTVHVVGRDGWLGRLSRTDDMEQVATFDGFGNRIAVSPDGHLIAVGTSTGLRVFTAGGEHRLTLPSSDIPWRGVSFSHDGRRLLVTTGTGQIQVWPLPLDLSGADLLATSPYSWALEGARRQIAVSAIAPTVADYERLVREGELQRARDLGNRLMSDALELADAIPLYEIAWAIVQNGAPEPRDLELGLRAAIASCELTSHREAHTLNALARVHFWQQDLPRAIEVQEQAVAAAHENPDTRNPQELVDVLEDYRVIQALDQYRTMLGTSRRAEAGDLGERLVDEAISAGKARHLNRIAWAIVDPAAPIERADRDLDLALRAATKAVELTDRDRGDMLDTLARVYFWLGDHRQALELQDDAVAVVLRNPSTGNLDNLRRTQQEYRRLVGR